MSDNHEEFAASYMEFIRAQMQAEILNRALGFKDEQIEVQTVLSNPTAIPEGWVEITCAGCGATGAVPAGTIPPGRTPICPDCTSKMVEHVQ